MARITVVLPPVLDRLPEAVEEAARAALAVAVEEGVSAAKQAAPVNTGKLKQGLYSLPIEREGNTLRGGIAASGVAAQYGSAIESGRRAGARGPTYRHLLFAPGFRDAKASDEAAQRGGWVNRQMRAEVEALAAKLLAADVADRAAHYGIKRKRGLSRRRALQRARFIIARGVAAAVHDKGIRAREFAKAQAPRIRARFAEAFPGQLRRRLAQ